MTRCADHRDDESQANGCPGCMSDMRKEVQTKWKPLLEAAEKAVIQIQLQSQERMDLLEAMDSVREAIK